MTNSGKGLPAFRKSPARRRPFSGYTGTEAREDRFKAEAGRYRILHVAAHGVLNDASPMYPHIVLSQGATDATEDGLLETWELMNLEVDLGDSLCGFGEYEFVAPGVLMVQGDGELQGELLLAYGYPEGRPDPDLRARLMLPTILYECSDLRKYALRLDPGAINLTLDQLERATWRFTTD